MSKETVNKDISSEVDGSRSGAAGSEASAKTIAQATSREVSSEEAGQETDAQGSVQEGTQAATETGVQAEPQESEDTQELTIEGLLAERDRLTKQNKEQLERLQRAQAEFENTRKRLLREKEEAQQYAAMGVIESLLPIVDDFERALAAPGIDPKIQEGLALIYRRIFEVFTRAGLKPIECEDGEFNPHLHHAVDRAPAEDDEQDNKILEVYQKGYMFKDRLLRAALVKVAVKE